MSTTRDAELNRALRGYYPFLRLGYLHDMSSGHTHMSSDSTRDDTAQAPPVFSNACLATAAPTWSAESYPNQSMSENDNIIETDKQAFESNVKRSRANSSSPTPTTLQSPTPDAPTECLLLALPPELRLAIYGFILLDHQDVIKKATLQLIHDAATTKRDLPQQRQILQTRQRVLVRPGIFAAHPLIRRELLPLYRATLRSLWNDYTKLANGNADHYLELLACGYYEPGSREVLACLDEFGRALADWILRESCSAGVFQWTQGRKFSGSEVRKTWRESVVPFERAWDLPNMSRLSRYDGEKKLVEGMQSRMRFTSSVIETLEFGPRVEGV